MAVENDASPMPLEHPGDELRERVGVGMEVGRSRPFYALELLQLLNGCIEFTDN